MTIDFSQSGSGYSDVISTDVLRSQCSMLSEIEFQAIDAETAHNNKKLPIGKKYINHSYSGKQGIILGPVIGLVTSNYARILVEVNFDTELSIILRGTDVTNPSAEHHYPNIKTKDATAYKPIVFEVRNLKPCHRYHVSFSLPYYDLVDCSFTTLPENIDIETFPLKFAVVSGNEVVTITEKPYEKASDIHKVKKLTHKTDESLWKDLYYRIRNENIHYILHIGNNVNIGLNQEDNSSSVFHKLAYENNTRADAVEAISKVYRKTWNEPWTKHCLANCSNIMMLNEIDIGKLIRMINNTSSTDEMRTAEAAFTCYQMYQQALIRPAAIKKTPFMQTSYIQLTRHITLLFIDWRILPTFRPENSDSNLQLIGANGLKLISDMFASLSVEPDTNSENSQDNKFSKMQQLLVLSSLQMCNPNEYIHLTPYARETEAFLDMLFSWKNGKNSIKKSAVILSGASVSAGLSSVVGRITDKETSSFIEEWVIGPMSKKVRCLQPYYKFNNDKYSFEIVKRFNTNNYGVITCGMRYNGVATKEDADIPGTLLYGQPVVWFEMFNTTDSKAIKNHAKGVKGEFKSLPRAYLKTTVQNI